MSDRPDPRCGGCRDLGAHVRWCSWVHGHNAATLGRDAAAAEALADKVGGNCPEAANALYRAAGLLTENARKRSDAYRAAQGLGPTGVPADAPRTRQVRA